MIVEQIIGMGTNLVAFFVTLVPNFDVPTWFSDIGSNINGFFIYARGLNSFVDWGFLALVAAIPLGLWVFGLLFRLARLLVSHVPFIGGH